MYQLHRVSPLLNAPLTTYPISKIQVFFLLPFLILEKRYRKLSRERAEGMVVFFLSLFCLFRPFVHIKKT